MKHHLSFDLEFKRNPYKGKFIVLEGIDGSGKTLQANRLAKILSKKHTVKRAKNPTDNPIGKFIRKILRGKISIPPEAIQYLFAADKHVQQVELKEYLKKNEIVIMDRYFWSAVAYGIVDFQLKEDRPSRDFLLFTQSILSLYFRQVVPDHTFYLQVPPLIAMKRLEESRSEKERYEDMEKLKIASRGYDWLAREFPEEITIIDGTQEVKAVTEEILTKLEV